MFATLALTNVRSFDGTPVAVEVTGAGPSVVLVCGAATTRAMNAPLAALLSERFTVHNYDRRGRGDSGDTLPYAVEREYEDLRAVIDLAGGSACVFGPSSGAILAATAAADGVPVGRLALWEPPFVAGTHDFPVDYAEHVDELLSQGRNGDALAYFMTDAVGLPAEMVAGIGPGPPLLRRRHGRTRFPRCLKHPCRHRAAAHRVKPRPTLNERQLL